LRQQCLSPQEKHCLFLWAAAAATIIQPGIACLLLLVGITAGLVLALPVVAAVRAAVETPTVPDVAETPPAAKPNVGRPRGTADMRVLTVLSEAAERGDPCPTNEDIAARLGMHSKSNIGAYIGRLRDDGVIDVDTASRYRVVTIVATGRSTARSGETRVARWWLDPAEMVRLVGVLADLCATVPDPTNAEVGAALGLPERTVHDVLTAMEKAGHIKKRRVGGHRRIEFTAPRAVGEGIAPLAIPPPDGLAARLGLPTLGVIPALRPMGSPGDTRLPDAGPMPKACQWIEGEPRQRQFCGTDAVPGRPWCDGHLARVFARGGDAKEVVA
jgi:DNA-binding MarR family transcriptional regulator